MKNGKFAFVFSTVMLVLALCCATLTVVIPSTMLGDINSETGFAGLGIAIAAVLMGIIFAIPTAVFGIVTVIFSSFSVRRSVGARKGVSIAWLSIAVLILLALGLAPVIL